MSVGDVDVGSERSWMRNSRAGMAYTEGGLGFLLRFLRGLVGSADSGAEMGPWRRRKVWADGVCWWLECGASHCGSKPHMTGKVRVRIKPHIFRNVFHISQNVGVYILKNVVKHILENVKR